MDWDGTGVLLVRYVAGSVCHALSLWMPTSPFLTVTDWRRDVVSSFMLDRKFWEIRRASCRRGWSGWPLGVCLSKS